MSKNLVTFKNAMNSLNNIEDLPESCNFIGQILWFTISEITATREQLKEYLTRTGLEEKYLPKPISPRDAFRKATSKMEAKKLDLADKKYLNILIREVKVTDDILVRQMVREIVDAKNVRLEYTPVANLILEGEDYRQELLIDSYKLTDLEESTLKNSLTDYEKAKEFYNGRNIREIVQNILSDCSPVALRPSGGVYFSPQEYYKKIKSLSTFLKEIALDNLNEKTKLYHIPVIDTEEQREIVRESLEEQAKKESMSLIEEMDKIIKSGKPITGKMVLAYTQKAKDLKALIEEYEDLLETQTMFARSAVEMVQKQIQKMIEKLEEDGAA